MPWSRSDRATVSVAASRHASVACRCEGTRYGAMFGPDVTFLGVDRCALADPASIKGADVAIVGAPFDGGTSHRPGARFGPQAIRSTDYLPHDGSRPHLALRVDALRDL